MLGTISAIGGALSGASSFLSGLGIGGSKKTSWKNVYSQIEANQYAENKAFDNRMAKAKEYGLHPLTMLGQPAYNPGSFSMQGSKKGIDLAEMGQGIDRMANAGRSSVQRKLDDLALEQASLSNDYLRVQIAGAQKAIAQSGATIPMDSGDSSSGNASSLLPLRSSPSVRVVKDQQVAKNSKDSGKTAGNHAAFMTLDLGGGYFVEVPKSDEWAESIGEMPAFYKWPKVAEIAGKRTAAKLREKKYSKKWLAPWDPRKYKK